MRACKNGIASTSCFDLRTLSQHGEGCIVLE
jgi:hypothetical protein